MDDTLKALLDERENLRHKLRKARRRIGELECQLSSALRTPIAFSGSWTYEVKTLEADGKDENGAQVVTPVTNVNGSAPTGYDVYIAGCW